MINQLLEYWINITLRQYNDNNNETRASRNEARITWRENHLREFHSHGISHTLVEAQKDYEYNLFSRRYFTAPLSRNNNDYTRRAWRLLMSQWKQASRALRRRRREREFRVTAWRNWQYLGAALSNKSKSTWQL